MGNGCPKYNEAVNKAFENDWVKEMELENKVSDVKFHPLTPTHTPLSGECSAQLCVDG